MNDKDMQAFDKWWDEIRLRGQSTFGIVAITWQAACEYKQKEIDELKNVTYWTVEQDGKVTRHISIAEIEKLQAENAKLRECVEFYAQPWERGELDGELLVRKSESYDLFTEVHYKAKQCLKELGDK